MNKFEYALTMQLNTFAVWTDGVECGLQELQNEGVTIDKISETLSTVPFNPATKEILEYLASKNVTLMIASDANTFYIDQILRHFNINQYFSRIYTNAGIIKDGRLSVSRYSGPDQPHGCALCPLNLCKVLISLSK